MASSVIFTIIGIIFKYGRGIIMLCSHLIGGFGHNGTVAPPTVDVIRGIRGSPVHRGVILESALRGWLCITVFNEVILL